MEKEVSIQPKKSSIKKSTEASKEQEPPQYFLIYNKIPLPTLNNMLALEIFLLILATIQVVFNFWIFQLVNFEGVARLEPVPQINYPLWRTSITLAYNLTWVQIIICGALIIFRKYFRNLTKVPITKRDDLKLDEKGNPILEEKLEDKSKKDESNQVHLRNHLSYYGIAILTILVLISFLNYFPRSVALFPSFILMNERYGMITRPSEYTTYLWMNLLWQFSIFCMLFFLLLFSVRQIKDMKRIINSKAHIRSEYKESQPQTEKDSWKPPLPKPWKLMTIQERKEYQQKLYQAEKIYAQQKQEEEFQKLLDEERARRRLGEKLYQIQKKEEKLSEKLTEKETKVKVDEKKQKDQYDFR